MGNADDVKYESLIKRRVSSFCGLYSLSVTNYKFFHFVRLATFEWNYWEVNTLRTSASRWQKLGAKEIIHKKWFTCWLWTYDADNQNVIFIISIEYFLIPINKLKSVAIYEFIWLTSVHETPSIICISQFDSCWLRFGPKIMNFSTYHFLTEPFLINSLIYFF